MNRITLPKPVSVNAMYRTKVRNGHSEMYVSKAGQAWFEEAGWLVKKFALMGVTKDVMVYVWLYTCRNGDIDNVAKPIMDLLQKSGVIVNDNQVVELHMYKERVKHVKDEKMELQVEVWE